MRKLIIICLPVLLLAAACKRTLPDYGATATVKMSNGWWVNYTAGGVLQNSKPLFFTTYNTSMSSDSMWIDDLSKFWEFKGKVKVDYANLTFSGTNSANAYYTSTATINNGKVLLKAGHSRAGNITDSIYLEIQFSDDPAPGTIYKVTGTARTGFIEDDY